MKKVNMICIIFKIMMLLDSGCTLFLLQLFTCIEHEFMGNADYYCDMPICSPCTPMQLTTTSGGQKANTMYVVCYISYKS